MKKESYISFILAGIFSLSACQDSVELTETSSQEVNLESRSVTPAYFDWETADFMPTPKGQARIDPPWHGQGSLAYMYGDDVLTDIKASDGWELLYSTFDANASAPLVNPYFILYNKYRGLMRIFFYLTTETITPSSQLEAELSVLSSKPSSLLNFMGKDFIDASQITKSYVHSQLKTVNNTPPLASNRWYMMQYELAYDPTISQYRYNDINFYWNLKYHNELFVNIRGEVKGDLVGTLGAASSSSNNKLSDLITTAGKGVLAGIGSDFLEKNKNNAAGAASNNKLGMPNSVFDNVMKGVNAALSAATGNFVGGAVNLLSAIIGGSSSQAIPISFDLSANMALEGTVTSEGAFPSTPITFWVPGTIGITSAPNYIPLYNKPLGVINFNGKPDIIVNHIHSEETYTYNDGSTVLDLWRTQDQYDIEQKDYSSYLQINPEVLKIADVEIESQDLIVEYSTFGPSYKDTGNYLYEKISINSTHFYKTYDPETLHNGTSPGRCGVRFAVRVTPHDGSPSSLIVKTFLLNRVDHTKNYFNGKEQK